MGSQLKKKMKKIERRVHFLIEAIVFDVDDTIYDQQQPFREAIEDCFPNVSEADMTPLYIRFRYHSDENFPKVLANQWSLAFMRAHRISQSLKDLGYPPITKEDGLHFQEVYEQALDNICMHPEVKKTLDYLQEQGVPMGVITNGPTDHQYKKVTQLALEEWIDSERIIISQATGFQKPEVEIFQLAEKNFGFNGQKTLYVGDNFDNDVIGAKNSGWQALWFNHRGRILEETTDNLCDIEISSFAELLQTIQELVKPVCSKV